MAGSLRRKTPLRANPEKVRAWKEKSRRELPKSGKKSKAWDRARAQGDKEIKRLGITRCEARLEGCTGSWALTRAHRYKRRFITTEAELQTYAILCASCHDKVEAMPHQEMFDLITEVIGRRIFG